MHNHGKARPGWRVRSAILTVTSLLIAGLIGGCRAHKPIMHSSADFVVLRNTPDFLDPVPQADIGNDTAYLAYRPGTRSAPTLVLMESRQPIKLDREPTNPIRWRGPPDATEPLLYEAVFKCGELTVRASAFFAIVDSAEHAAAQLEIMGDELSARCAELSAGSTVTPS